MKKIVNSNQAPEPIGPYSQAVVVDKTIYVSGQIAIDQSSGNLVNENIQAETKQVMINLGFVLKQAGYEYSDIVKCSIFIKSMEDFTLINEIYGQYFKLNPPARETVEVSGLPKNVNVEISCIAVKE